LSVTTYPFTGSYPDNRTATHNGASEVSDLNWGFGCIEDREEDEWDGKRLEQRDDEHAEPTQMLVAQAAQIGLLTEEGSQ
jgi:hypothetical protein